MMQVTKHPPTSDLDILQTVEGRDLSLRDEDPFLPQERSLGISKESN